MQKRVVGIEAGGTKVVCATGSGPDDVGSLVRIPTTTPQETMGAVAEYVRSRQAEESIAAVGIASFGPLDLDRSSPNFGHLTTTPKPGWQGVDLVGLVAEVADGPVAIDTDVNGAGLAELVHGAGRSAKSLAYVTVGTGIGVGIVIDGRPVHGLMHPEAGHLLVRRDPRDTFAGRCPSHGDCLEGLACGPAWLERWGDVSDEMAPEERDLALEIEAHYLAQLVMTLVLTVSPERVVIGGGVMGDPDLLPRVVAEAGRLLNNYIDVPALRDGLADYVVAPALGDRAGVLGAILLGQDT